MAEDRLAFLFDHYITGTCTEAEKQELALLVLSSGNDTVVEDLLEKAWRDLKPQEILPEERASLILNSILQQNDNSKELLLKEPPGKVIKLFPWRRIAVAISVLLLVGLGTYFLIADGGLNKKEIVKNDSLHQNVAPGGNKAILTLADGSAIVLDSAHNGMVIQEGNAKIIKLSDGNIAYQKGNSEESTVHYNKITTPRGGQYQLTLADGSRVWLNAASSITFPTIFTGKEREVTLSGEAYFEVAHNAKMPFRVKVNEMEVQVLGTHFNVNAYEDEGAIITTLLEGSVKVSEGKESVLIKPGEQTRVLQNSNGNGKISVYKADIEKAVAWKNGLFQFNDDQLEAILKQISRWYNIDVECAADKKNLRFNGIISRRSNVKAVVDLLSATGVVNFKIEKEKGKLIAY